MLEPGLQYMIVGYSESGDRGIRTPDLRDANAALSQLSYIPIEKPILAKAMDSVKFNDIVSYFMNNSGV
jgi:hypothetical protein